MKYDIFKDSKDKSSAKHHLETLEKSEGWEYIIRALDANIAFLTDELKEENFDDLLPVQLCQKQIVHLKELKDLPQAIIEAAQPEPDEEDTEIY